MQHIISSVIPPLGGVLASTLLYYYKYTTVIASKEYPTVIQ